MGGALVDVGPAEYRAVRIQVIRPSVAPAKKGSGESMIAQQAHPSPFLPSTR